MTSDTDTEPTQEPAGTDRIGPYLLVTQLGAGAMGRVFLGRDGNGRQAAVKMVRSDLAEVQAFRKRFSRELEVARRVHSPRVAEIYDAEPDSDQPWLATEYVPGPTLQEAVEQTGCLDNKRLRSLAAAIAEALIVIHAADVVHRDLKPANVLLGPDGPKVIDFGVARALDASLLTNTGQTLGTPAYMSPEQADGRSVGSASDVFALGSLLVFAATGRLAFGDGPPLAILHRVVNNEPDLKGVAQGDTELRRIVEGCFAKEAGDRPTPQHIIETLGSSPWQPVDGIVWQKPPLGVGLPINGNGNGTSNGNDGADELTVALVPKRRTKRIAFISAATVAALVLATVAVVEGMGGGGGTPSASSSRSGDQISSTNPAGGAVPSGADGSNPATNGGAGTTPGGAAGGNSNGPASPGASPAANPGGGVAPTAGSSTSLLVAPGSGGQQTSAGQGQQNPGSTTPGTKPTSHATPPPTSAATTPPPAHHAPGPIVPGEIHISIPTWFGAATVNLSWNTHSDATSYDVHWTDDFGNGTNQTVNVTGTTYSFTMPAGSKACIQIRTNNQYGSAAYYPIPMYCFNDMGQQVS